MKRLTILLIASVVMCACEKTLDLKYDSMEPILVIDAQVSTSGIKARMSYSKDVKNNDVEHESSATAVTVNGDDGSSVALSYDVQGWYRAPAGAVGKPGVNYTFSAVVEGKTYVAESRMPRAVAIDSVVYRDIKIMGEDHRFACIYFQDTPGEDNYYYYLMYVNQEEEGESPYEWDIMDDENEDGKQIMALINCSEEEEGAGMNGKDKLEAGDKVRIEFRVVDEFTYKYLTAVRVANPFRPGNPPASYSETCLGYFSAFAEIVFEEIFDGETH